MMHISAIVKRSAIRIGTAFVFAMLFIQLSGGLFGILPFILDITGLWNAFGWLVVATMAGAGWLLAALGVRERLNGGAVGLISIGFNLAIGMAFSAIIIKGVLRAL